jgi:hypothetical protein
MKGIRKGLYSRTKLCCKQPYKLEVIVVGMDIGGISGKAKWKIHNAVA